MSGLHRRALHFSAESEQRVTRSAYCFLCSYYMHGDLDREKMGGALRVLPRDGNKDKNWDGLREMCSDISALFASYCAGIQTLPVLVREVRRVCVNTIIYHLSEVSC